MTDSNSEYSSRKDIAKNKHSMPCRFGGYLDLPEHKQGLKSK